MSNQPHLQQFKNQLAESLLSKTFVKVSLGNYQGGERELKQIHIRPVRIKRNDMLSFTYRYKTRDIVKNFSVEEGISLVSDHIDSDFKVATLFMLDKEIILEHKRKQQISIREQVTNRINKLDLSHDKVKKRLIPSANKPYLVELKLTDSLGNVFKNAQDKYRQINQYIEILNSLIKELPAGSLKQVADMGSGKGYLTFALYDYFHQVLKEEVKVTGIEYREDMVQLCNSIAKRSGFGQLDFIQGSIEDYMVPHIDLLIALHACDTATDEAIFKGIKANAKLIVVAPCCHKQIRREMEKSKVKNEVSVLTKYGIFLERQAEMVTDGIRALILEYFGYKTKVFEFISDVHTPKNVLVVGIKSDKVELSHTTGEVRKLDVLRKISETKAYFGISYHYLERLLELDQLV